MVTAKAKLAAVAPATVEMTPTPMTGSALPAKQQRT
jgi:hypothetical protein